MSPVNQAPHVFRCSLEDGLDPAVWQVAHPAADVMLLGHLAARVAEEHTLDAAGDEYPVADHEPDVIVTARRRLHRHNNRISGGRPPYQALF